jgi:hypothetical protein
MPFGQRPVGENALETTGAEVAILMRIACSIKQILRFAAAISLSTSALFAQDNSGNGLDFPMLVNVGGKCGYIDEQGKLVISPKYTRADSFDSSGLAIVRLSKKYGLINRAGNFALPAIYDEISGSGAPGLFQVKRGEKFGYVDQTGKLLTPIIYDKIGYFGKAGLAKATLGEKESVVDIKGRVVFEIPDGASMADFDDSEITAFSSEQSDKTGFVDRNGTFVLPPIWDNASGFGDGSIAPVEKDGKWGFIDKTGKLVV